MTEKFPLENFRYLLVNFDTIFQKCRFFPHFSRLSTKRFFSLFPKIKAPNIPRIPLNSQHDSHSNRQILFRQKTSQICCYCKLQQFVTEFSVKADRASAMASIPEF